MNDEAIEKEGVGRRGYRWLLVCAGFWKYCRHPLRSPYFCKFSFLCKMKFIRLGWIFVTLLTLFFF